MEEDQPTLPENPLPLVTAKREEEEEKQEEDEKEAEADLSLLSLVAAALPQVTTTTTDVPPPPPPSPHLPPPVDSSSSEAAAAAAAAALVEQRGLFAKAVRRQGEQRQKFKKSKSSQMTSSELAAARQSRSRSIESTTGGGRKQVSKRSKSRGRSKDCLEDAIRKAKQTEGGKGEGGKGGREAVPSTHAHEGRKGSGRSAEREGETENEQQQPPQQPQQQEKSDKEEDRPNMIMDFYCQLSTNKKLRKGRVNALNRLKGLQPSDLAIVKHTLRLRLEANINKSQTTPPSAPISSSSNIAANSSTRQHMTTAITPTTNQHSEDATPTERQQKGGTKYKDNNNEAKEQERDGTSTKELQWNKETSKAKRKNVNTKKEENEEPSALAVASAGIRSSAGGKSTPSRALTEADGVSASRRHPKFLHKSNRSKSTGSLPVLTSKDNESERDRAADPQCSASPTPDGKKEEEDVNLPLRSSMPSLEESSPAPTASNGSISLNKGSLITGNEEQDKEPKKEKKKDEEEEQEEKLPLPPAVAISTFIHSTTYSTLDVDILLRDMVELVGLPKTATEQEKDMFIAFLLEEFEVKQVLENKDKITSSMHKEGSQLWQLSSPIIKRPLSSLCCHQDFARLAKKFQISADKQIVCGPFSEDMSKVECVKLILDTLAMQMNIGTLRKDIATHLHAHVASDQDLLDPTGLQELFEGVIGEECALLQLIKGTTQALIAPSVTSLKTALNPFSFNSVRNAWQVFIEFERSGAISITHRKVEEAAPDAEARYGGFRFEWAVEFLYCNNLTRLVHVRPMLLSVRGPKKTRKAIKKGFHRFCKDPVKEKKG
ncbi:hypothetical protein QOT17_002540 [Balamuthia mandrillaris]